MTTRTPIDPRDVRLDESTDAGEFVHQNISRVNDAEKRKAASDVLCTPEPTPEQLARALGDDRAIYDAILGGLGEYGMEFESMRDRREMTVREARLAESGIVSGEKFVRAALTIAREAK